MEECRKIRKKKRICHKNGRVGKGIKKDFEMKIDKKKNKKRKKRQ
jgi:hypothetical protein